MEPTGRSTEEAVRRETLKGVAGSPRILLVEDIDFMARLVMAQLQAAGYKSVTIAHDGAEAMEALVQKPYDMLITDWMMTPVGGRELCHNLRRAADSPCPGIAIIAVSAHIDHNAIDEMLKAGVDEVVAKPIALDELLKRVRTVTTEPRQFVRTKTYFGPDRRRRYKADFGLEDRRKTQARLEARPASRHER
ncbi:response regulator [Gimibacter soli]|uniref:Response regulator n=1 Tax=Gimibacter soli TaxID=3024400 RepID=A0AAF0BMR3_9PROT|nr:response regulator [Gimibacter soli]WCL54841.1 response regulator [Gimibacter soli]